MVMIAEYSAAVFLDGKEYRLRKARRSADGVIHTLYLRRSGTVDEAVVLFDPRLTLNATTGVWTIERYSVRARAAW